MGREAEARGERKREEINCSFSMKSMPRNVPCYDRDIRTYLLPCKLAI